jgi:hypothetical protein
MDFLLQGVAGGHVAQHNQLPGLQGGQADEYFHLKEAEHTELSDWLGVAALSSDGSMTLGSVFTVDTTTPAIKLYADILTDRWLESNTNFFLGPGAGGAGNLTHGSGFEGWYNAVVGGFAGENITTAAYLMLLGFKAGNALTIEDYNVYMGGICGEFAVDGENNTCSGFAAHRYGKGSNNAVYGESSASASGMTASNCSFYGRRSGFLHTSGGYETNLGHGAGYYGTISEENVNVGAGANAKNQTGKDSVIIGTWAGYGSDLHSKSGCIYIGNRVGQTNDNSNLLIIDNHDSATPFLFGEIANHNFGLNIGGFGTNAAGTFAMALSTMNTADVGNQFHLGGTDQVAGNTSPTFRTEAGQTVILYTQAHIADASASHTITDPADTPADADALRDDLVANTIPSIESALDALGAKVNAILVALENPGLLATS